MRRDWPSLFLSGSGQPNVRANNVIVRARAIHFAALVSVAALVWVGQSDGAGQASSGAYKPLSSLGHLQPAPYAGKLGPELTPIPNAPLLAEPASAATPTKSIDGIKCEGMERMVFHIHAHLVVVVNGKYRVIPYGVGIGPPLRGENTKAGAFVTQGSCFSWIHTHAADGIFHLEGPAERTAGRVLRHMGAAIECQRGWARPWSGDGDRERHGLYRRPASDPVAQARADPT
jgi:hypothetical protein